MGDPNITTWLPGHLCTPNTRKSDLWVDYSAEEDERILWIAWHFDRDDDVGPPRRNFLEAARIPEPRPIAALADLTAQFEERLAAHPLAGQLPSTAKLVAEALAVAPPLEVAEAACRGLCAKGFARALAAALEASAGGPYRSAIDGDALRRLARAAGDDILVRVDTSMLRVDEISYGMWKRLEHDGTAEGQTMAYDRAVREALGRRVERIARRLDAAPGELEAAWEPPLPEQIVPLEEALDALEPAFGERPSVHEPYRALRNLCGQPLAGVRPLVAALLGGATSLPTRGGRTVPRRREEPYLWSAALEILATSDMDLSAQVEARAREQERKAREEAERRAQQQNQPPPPPPPPAPPAPARAVREELLILAALVILALVTWLMGMC